MPEQSVTKASLFRLPQHCGKPESLKVCAPAYMIPIPSVSICPFFLVSRTLTRLGRLYEDVLLNTPRDDVNEKYKECLSLLIFFSFFFFRLDGTARANSVLKDDGKETNHAASRIRTGRAADFLRDAPSSSSSRRTPSFLGALKYAKGQAQSIC